MLSIAKRGPLLKAMVVQFGDKVSVGLKMIGGHHYPFYLYKAFGLAFDSAEAIDGQNKAAVVLNGGQGVTGRHRKVWEKCVAGSTDTWNKKLNMQIGLFHAQVSCTQAPFAHPRPPTLG